MENKTASIWQEQKTPNYYPLNRSARFDVAVVGAGITGVMAAYLLSLNGKKVCLLDREEVGGVDTSHTTAHLTYVTDARLTDLINSFGEDGARLAWTAGEYAIDLIEEIVKNENIDCGFKRVPGYLHSSLNHRDVADEAQLEKEAAKARELGFEAEFAASVPFMRRPGIRFADQAKFHPLKFINGLLNVIVKNGGEIFERSEAGDFEDEPLSFKVSGTHRVDADYLVIATHVPLVGNNSLISSTFLQTKLALYSSYAIGAKIKKGVIPEANFWDTTDPYYYLRVDSHADHDYLIFGGEDHKTGQIEDTQALFRKLEEFLQKLVPGAVVDHRWSAQVIEPYDGLPFIGTTAERQFASTGYSGNGMTFGTLSGAMAADAVLGRMNPWSELFSIERTKIRGGIIEYVKENVDFPYHFLRDRLRGEAENDPDKLAPGEGKVMRLNGKRVACYREPTGELRKLSALRTHMGCIVRWNTAEKTWDCPCHGSRFHAAGRVLHGPAETDLKTHDG